MVRRGPLQSKVKRSKHCSRQVLCPPAEFLLEKSALSPGRVLIHFPAPHFLVYFPRPSASSSALSPEAQLPRRLTPSALSPEGPRPSSLLETSALSPGRVLIHFPAPIFLSTSRDRPPAQVLCPRRVASALSPEGCPGGLPRRVAPEGWFACNRVQVLCPRRVGLHAIGGGFGESCGSGIDRGGRFSRCYRDQFSSSL